MRLRVLSLEEVAMLRRKRSAPRRKSSPRTAEASRRSVIVTFKRKDRRPDARIDKQEVFASCVRAPVQFHDLSRLARGSALTRPSPGLLAGFDVNHYEAPLLMTWLTDAEITALRRNGNVERVENDGFCHALGTLHEPHLVVEDQPPVREETIPAGIAQIRAPEAWDVSRGKAIKVAVIDTGIDEAHPDLKPNLRGRISFVPSEDSAQDFNGHGTHCAGTIAAALNGQGVVGVAPAASLYAVKVLDRMGSGQWSWLIAAIDWCLRQDVRILSMSLGGPEAPQALQDMCDLAWSRGHLLVAAAGNTGGAVGVPAQYDSVVAVSAIDGANVIAPFSSRGPEVELCAPGVNVLSTTPGGGYGKKSGTSMACPHVSGTAALAWGAHRFATSRVIRRLLAWTADNLGNPGRDELYGFGRIDAEQAACALTEPPEVPGIP
jgi:subtilisin